MSNVRNFQLSFRLHSRRETGSRHGKSQLEKRACDLGWACSGATPSASSTPGPGAGSMMVSAAPRASSCSRAGGTGSPLLCGYLQSADRALLRLAGPTVDQNLVQSTQLEYLRTTYSLPRRLLWLGGRVSTGPHGSSRQGKLKVESLSPVPSAQPLIYHHSNSSDSPSTLMSLFTWSSRKTDVALGGTRITVEFIKELANIIPAHCVSPIVGAALKMIDMIEVRF